MMIGSENRRADGGSLMVLDCGTLAPAGRAASVKPMQALRME